MILHFLILLQEWIFFEKVFKMSYRALQVTVFVGSKFSVSAAANSAEFLQHVGPGQGGDGVMRPALLLLILLVLLLVTILAAVSVGLLQCCQEL